jgi:ATP-dependent exoDNAse (exonuclease V) beta subunit
MRAPAAFAVDRNVNNAMNAKVQIADADARERALDPLRSFIVQAPAGSGKTDLLVRRFVRLLDSVERPEEVLAITFTRKAAAEMKKRVLTGLPKAAELAPRLRIMTIDSLCAALTRQLPVLAKFGAQPAIAEAEDAKALYLDAATRTLALLEQAGDAAEWVARLLRHLDNDAGAAAALLASMLARRDQWLRRAGNPPTRTELEGAFAAERARLLARAQALHPDASEALALEVLTKSGGWRKKPKPAPADMVGNEPLRDALFALTAMPPAHYTDAQWEALEAILALLKRAAAELKLVFAARGQADFTEFAQGAVRALGSADDPSELLLRMDASVRHILVDEFQDTSVSQWELLEHLTAGWEQGDGRTVFAVGDPMQSIYRFREAEVALFLHARHAGLGGVCLESLTLTTNFRSQAGIVDWVNATFTRVLPAEEDESSGAVPYSPAAPHPDNVRLAGEAARWHAFTVRADEARRVVEIVQQAQKEKPAGSCAILVRNRSALADIVPALNAAGLRYRAVEIEKLGEKQVVQDLYALTRALSHPADRIAWLALLRARWCGLDLTDLHALAGDGERDAESDIFSHAPLAIWELLHDESRLAALSDAARARAERVRAALAPIMVNALRGSLRARVEGAWYALGGPACVDAATDLEDAEIFLDQLDRLEDAGDIADPALLAESLDELYALPDLEAVDTDLQVMTIHKAKGLEFDTVIVPGLDRAPRTGERPLLAWKAQADTSLLLAPINETGVDSEPLYRYVREQGRRAEDTEAGRLLYVAATRAKSCLHLLGCVKLDEHAAVRAPSKRSLLGCAWSVAADAFQSPAQSGAAAVAPVSLDAAGTGAHGGGDALRRLSSGFTTPAPPPSVQWQSAEVTRNRENDIEFSWVGETTRHVGSVVHRWLQRIADDELQDWNVQRVEALRATFANELAACGVDANELVPAAARVSQALAAALGDARGQWLLGPQRDAHNEYRLTAVIDGVRRKLVIDRTFTDAEGRRWIVDYKTGVREGADVEAFLEQERERYRAQLERYARALAQGEAAMLGLYFPLLAGWREWGA